MAKKIPKPHDLFLRATLSSPQAIHDLFQAHLPEQLRKRTELNSIVPTQPNHISPMLKELHSDFIFTCQIDGHNPEEYSQENVISLFKETLSINNKEDIMKTIARQIEKRGEIKGIELGIKNRNLAIARNMLMKGYDIKSIQEITELAKEMIENLKKGK